MKVLPDGTYLARLKPPLASDGPPVTVRVIEYTVHTTAEGDGAEQSSEVFCLVTDPLDTEEYPALDLACTYPDRWGCETVIGRHKTDMGEGQPILRSKNPRASPRKCERCSPSTKPPASSSAPAWTPWASPGTDQLPARPRRRDQHGRGFPPDRIEFHLLQPWQVT